jgi:dTDP-glucose pyrophosphorylase
MPGRALIAELGVKPDLQLMQAIEAITRGSKKIILVLGNDQKLLGIVTDYDIRKAILARMPFETPVTAFMKTDPVTVRADMSEDEVFAVMTELRCHQVPVLDEADRAVGVRFVDEFVHRHGGRGEHIAVVMAGGIGTRLRPITYDTPKPLLSIGGKPILFILLDQMFSERFDRVFVSVNYKADAIVNAIRDAARYRGNVEFLFEKEPLGTAGSLRLLPVRPSEPFAVVNGDLLTNVSLAEMRNFHRSEGNRVTVALKRETYTIPYGVAEVDGGRIKRLKEKPAYDHYVNTGVYIVDPEVIDLIPHGERCDMTTLVDNALASNASIGWFPVHEYWLDIGTPAQYERAQEDYHSHFTAK